MKKNQLDPKGFCSCGYPQDVMDNPHLSNSLKIFFKQSRQHFVSYYLWLETTGEIDPQDQQYADQAHEHVSKKLAHGLWWFQKIAAFIVRKFHRR